MRLRAQRQMRSEAAVPATAGDQRRLGTNPRLVARSCNSFESRAICLGAVDSPAPRSRCGIRTQAGSSRPGAGRRSISSNSQAKPCTSRRTGCLAEARPRGDDLSTRRPPTIATLLRTENACCSSPRSISVGCARSRFSRAGRRSPGRGAARAPCGAGIGWKWRPLRPIFV
jgi:hypothetical protein